MLRVTRPFSEVALHLGVVVALLAILGLAFRRSGGRKYAPGPAGLPLIGNILQIDTVDPRKTFASWHRQYGPVLRLKIGWSDFIILGTIPTTKDLFGTRGAKYSSRPDMTMARENMMKNMQTSTLPYGQKWKLHNRIQLSLLNTRMLNKYQALVQVEAQRTLIRLLTADDLIPCFNRLQFNVLYSLAYAKDPEKHDADFREILELQDIFTQTMTNSTWIVNLFPFLNVLPTFVAPWKRYGDRFHARTQKWFAKNTKYAMEETDRWSWTNHVMTDDIRGDLTPIEIQNLIGVLFEAGVDSNATVLHYFVVAYFLYPEAVARARRELDATVGSSRSPKRDDLATMPYMHGFVKEVLRWRPITQGLPHSTTEDDTYMGYKIRKGSTILFNHVDAHRDEDVYPDPGAFRPERFIKNPNLPLGAFGFGRRSCPGRHFAMMVLETMIPNLLWAYDFETTADLEPLKDAYTGANVSGALLRPPKFSITWKIRDQERKTVLIEEFERIKDSSVRI